MPDKKPEKTNPETSSVQGEETSLAQPKRTVSTRASDTGAHLRVNPHASHITNNSTALHNWSNITGRLSTPESQQLLHELQHRLVSMRESWVTPEPAYTMHYGLSNDPVSTHIELRPKKLQVESEITELRKSVEEKASALLSVKADSKRQQEQQQEQIRQLKETLEELGEKERLAHLLTRVGEPAQKKLLESEEFRSQFDQDTPQDAYVLSIDIRRSTELMLKAREPKLFAEFITTLAKGMRELVLRNLGVFDKFTGDGVLAFFPKFFSGDDAGYLAVKTASECHELFDQVYKSHRRCFAAVLKDTGLGIGLDYGEVQLVQIGGDFTVVGTPVVYACRMSGATAGTTLANVTAYEWLFEEFSEHCDFTESEIAIKHDGLTLAFEARLNGKAYEFRRPAWLEEAP